MMKNFTKLFALAVVMMAFSMSTSAQETSTASATATAEIIAPISIANAGNMSFGNIVATAPGGTVILSPAAGRIGSGVQLPVNPGTVTAAAFTVTGAAGYAYDLSLPANGYAITTGGATAPETMTLSTFSSNSTGVITGGSVTFQVGATLNVVANQVAGTYTNATGFDVTVNYN